MQLHVVVLCLGLAAAAAGCAKVKAAVCVGMVPAPNAGAAGGPAAPDAAKAAQQDEHGADANAEAGAAAHTATEGTGPQEEFALPFAWEKSPSEPLSRTRAYLRDMARDNAQYMRRGADFFKSSANVEAARATILSCADSRVQPAAFDLTPENDAYTVRNLGNQLNNTLGAVQYGVEELSTPLLVVLGHTGCTAVKAALTGNTSKLSEPIRKELAALKLSRPKAKAKGKDAAKAKKSTVDDQLRDAVLENIHDQVETALLTFASRVNAGQLTIIGAVYDPRNELEKGAGKVSIINVNGITEPARLKAFHEAVLAGASYDSSSGAQKPVDPFERLSQVFAEHLKDDEENADENEEAEPHPLAPMQHQPNAPAPGATLPAHKAAHH